MSTYHLTSDAIGKILFTQRNALGKSQRAIANEMDYKNVNFLFQ
jgi:hypothetical protein